MDAGQATLWSLELPGLAGRLAEAIAATQLASAVGLLAFPLTAPLLHAVWKVYWRRRTRQRLASRIRQQVQAPPSPLEQQQPEQPTQDGRPQTAKQKRQQQGQGRARLRHQHSQSRARQRAVSSPAVALLGAGSDSSRASSAAGDAQQQRLTQASRSATPSWEQLVPDTSARTAAVAAAQPAAASAAPKAAGLLQATNALKPSAPADKQGARGQKPGKQQRPTVSPPAAQGQADAEAEQPRNRAGRHAARSLRRQTSGQALNSAALPVAQGQDQQQLAAPAAGAQAIWPGQQRQLSHTGRQQAPSGTAVQVFAEAETSSPRPAAPAMAAGPQPCDEAAGGSLPSDQWVPPTPPRRQPARAAVHPQAVPAACQAYRPPLQPTDLLGPQLAMPSAPGSGAVMAAPGAGSLLQDAEAEAADAGQPGSSMSSHASAMQSPLQLPSLHDAVLSMLPAVLPSGTTSGQPGAPSATVQLAGRAQLAAAPAGAGAGWQDLCVVCWEQPRQTVLVGCGHMALCRHCALGLMQQAEPLCPICRRSVSMVQQVFLP